MGRKFGFSFSWKRALGLSAAKGRVSRAIGIPLTKSGRQRKAGRLLGDLAGTALIAGSHALQTSDSEPVSQATIAATQAVQGLRNQIASGEAFSAGSLMGKALIERGGRRCQNCELVYGASAARHCGMCGVLLI